ncbi:zinc ribbon domain-containing protein [Aureliella helgolandensis]|uniref:Zinc ribbon domain protein n=1 Tax=Aureliella helgolandensis TaxID=2527968 RepID=A0A518G023_9BACT|nr:phospholipase [Aureliella helgolandensis]QDV21941.1 Putative zinc ribbon domain protein [Aureliella helgolandensis]
MTASGPLVHRLHRINRQKTDLLGQLARGPKVVGVVQNKLRLAEAYVEQIRGTIQQTKMEADSKQLQMKEREGKIVNWQSQMNASKENRAYQTLKEQIAADTQANVVLSDEILEALEAIDEQEQLLSVALDKVEEVKGELAEVSQRIADKKVVLESELARVGTELEAAEAELSGEFKREYLRLVAAKGEDAMAELEGKCCGGCYQNLTPQIMEKLLVGQTVMCPACGRLLYQVR